MQFRRPEHFTRKTDGIVGSTFNIQMTDKLFETLYSKLYKFKEEAVVRELMCNYLDSHQMRDRVASTAIPSYVTSSLVVSTPFQPNPWLAYGRRGEVHLPSELEPYLEVKDFGIGLSIEKIIGAPLPARVGEFLLEGNRVVGGNINEEDGSVIEYQLSADDVVTGHPGLLGDQLVFRDPYNNEIIRGPGLYTTLFHSTKETDNSQIGAFGLGSKSPFSVSDSFTVEARWNGEIHNFLMFLDDKRIPRVDVLTKDYDTRDPKPIPTGEKNGLTIRVPVKSSRYFVFNQALAKLCRVFLPSELPIIDSEVPCVVNPIHRDNKVANTFIQPKVNIGRHFAVMGGVAYPIEHSVLSEELRDVLVRMPETYTMFELGSINVPPSREELEYGEITVQEIENTLSYVRDNFVSGLVKRILDENEKSRLHGIMAWKQIESDYGESMGKLVHNSMPADPRFSNKYESVRIPRLETTKTEGVYTDQVYAIPFTMTEYEGTSRSEVTKIDTDQLFKRTVSFVVMDNTRAFLQKIKQLTGDRYGHSVYVITPSRGMNCGMSVITDETGQRVIKGFKDPEKVLEFHDGWFGTGKEIDYVKFGDKFLEHFEGLIDDVRLMSELTYEKLVVEPYPGILRFNYLKGSTGTPQVKDLRGADVVTLSERGLIPYVLISGWNISHPGIKSYHALEKAAEILGISAGKDESGSTLNLGRRMGLAGSEIYLGRRKAVTFMKAHEACFVDINEVMKMLASEVSKYRDLFQYMVDRDQYQESRNQWGLANHALWIAKEAGNPETIKAAEVHLEAIRPSWERVQRVRRAEAVRKAENRQLPVVDGGIFGSPNSAHHAYNLLIDSPWRSYLKVKLDYCEAAKSKPHFINMHNSLNKDVPGIFTVTLGTHHAKFKAEARSILERSQLLKLLASFKPHYLRYGESVEKYRERILRDLIS